MLISPLSETSEIKSDLAQLKVPLALNFVDANFSYGAEPVLTGISGSLELGQALALIGPNGSGKTTLLRGILGTVKTGGTMEILGMSRSKLPKGTMGYVPQVADLDITFPITVQKVVEMGLYAQLGLFERVNGRQKKEIQRALTQVKMDHLAKRRFGELSGGQRQRVLVARAIVSRPKIILLDEPFNGLDEPNRNALLDIISWIKSQNVAVVVSTHDMELAYVTCEQVALLAGRQIGFGPIKEVLTAQNVAKAYGGSAALCAENHKLPGLSDSDSVPDYVAAIR